jgi:sugar-phosphatase
MQAVIFDMDGLLIDSEPLWREAEIAVFESVGLRLTDQLCRETIGLRADEVVRHWHTRFPWSEPSCEQVTGKLLDAAQRLIVEHGSLMDGARDVITELHAQDAKLAIASSSPMRLIRAVVEKFTLGSYFSVLHSAEHEIVGKPDPAVYRTTMTLLGTDPHQCVAFEDSLSGVRAAKAAGAMVIAVPASEDARDPGFAVADAMLTSLKDFSLDLIQPPQGVTRPR